MSSQVILHSYEFITYVSVHPPVHYNESVLRTPLQLEALVAGRSDSVYFFTSVLDYYRFFGPVGVI